MSFFFSSRRRHTRWPRDWSSDVCSSDLVDVIGFCLPADQKIGPGDRFIAEDLAELRRGRRGPKVIAIVTKTDLVGRDVLAEHLVAVDQLLDVDEIVPISAVRNEQIDVLLEVIGRHLPEGPQLYPEEQRSEEH